MVGEVMEAEKRSIWSIVSEKCRTARRFISWRRAVLLAIVSVIALVGLSLRLDYLASLPYPFVDDLADASSIQRLLVIAPHCDDEVISSAGLIQAVLSRGGQVRVVLVTNGDGSFTGTMIEFKKIYPRTSDYLRSGVQRQQETLRAMESLGVSTEDVIFLSYPDQGILPLWDKFWDSGTPYRSPFTRLTQSPYERTYNPQAVYSGQSLLSDLCSIIKDFRPDTVLAPHPADTHRDHWATGAFAALAVAMQEPQPRPRLLLYLVHRLDYPLPRGYLPFAPLLPPMRLVNNTFRWGKVTLSDEAVEAKGRAVELYKSQLPLLGNFLRSFVRQNELFCTFAQISVPKLAEGQVITAVPAQWQAWDGSEVKPLIEDSARDSLAQDVGAGGDFVALYGARTDHELWVVAELRGKASSLLSYTCLCRGFNGQEVHSKRVVFPRKLRARPRSEASGNYILARFCLEELGYPKVIMVSFEASYPGGKAVDRIGWVLADMDSDASLHAMAKDSDSPCSVQRPAKSNY